MNAGVVAGFQSLVPPTYEFVSLRWSNWVFGLASLGDERGDMRWGAVCMQALVAFNVIESLGFEKYHTPNKSFEMHV